MGNSRSPQCQWRKVSCYRPYRRLHSWGFGRCGDCRTRASPCQKAASGQRSYSVLAGRWTHLLEDEALEVARQELERWRVSSLDWKINFIPGQSQIADVGTKPLGTQRL